MVRFCEGCKKNVSVPHSCEKYLLLTRYRKACFGGIIEDRHGSYVLFSDVKALVYEIERKNKKQ